MKNLKVKLLNARKEILETKIKKEGRNSFSKYDYFTPSQITALVTKACIDNSILTMFRIEKINEDMIGVLDVLDLESDSKLTFTMITAMPDIKATNITQKLGGLVTYTQRYLETIAFGITDNNLDLDNQDNSKEKEVKKPTLTTERFEKALKEIKKGNTTKEVVMSKFSLSESQLNIINLKVKL